MKKLTNTILALLLSSNVFLMVGVIAFSPLKHKAMSISREEFELQLLCNQAGIPYDNRVVSAIHKEFEKERDQLRNNNKDE